MSDKPFHEIVGTMSGQRFAPNVQMDRKEPSVTLEPLAVQAFPIKRRMFPSPEERFFMREFPVIPLTQITERRFDLIDRYAKEDAMHTVACQKQFEPEKTPDPLPLGEKQHILLEVLRQEFSQWDWTDQSTQTRDFQFKARGIQGPLILTVQGVGDWCPDTGITYGPDWTISLSLSPEANVAALRAEKRGKTLGETLDEFLEEVPALLKALQD